MEENNTKTHRTPNLQATMDKSTASFLLCYKNVNIAWFGLLGINASATADRMMKAPQWLT